jgi:hypothetical protein
MFHAKLNKHNKPSHKDIVRFINKIPYYKQKIPFEENFKLVAFKRMVKNIIGIPIILDKTNTMFCTTFIGYCLKQLNILDSNINTDDIMLPAHFLFLKNSNNQKLYNTFYLIKT